MLYNDIKLEAYITNMNHKDVLFDMLYIGSLCVTFEALLHQHFLSAYLKNKPVRL